MKARLLVFLPLTIIYLAILFPDSIIRVTAPEFHASHRLVGDRDSTRSYRLASRLLSSDQQSVDNEFLDELIKPSLIFHEYSFRGTVVRFLLTPASPWELGSMGETSTWKRWLGISGTWLGVSKLMFISLYFVMLAKLVLFVKGDLFDDEESLESKALMMTVVYWVVGGIVLPLIAWSINAFSGSEMIVVCVIVNILGFLLGLALRVVEFLAVDLFGLLLRCFCLPVLFLHSWIAEFVSSFF